MTAAGLEITKDTKELSFKVTRGQDQPRPGQHKNLFCQVILTQNGEPIVQNIGSTELRIDVPLPKAAAAAKPQAAPSSRLAANRETIEPAGTTAAGAGGKRKGDSKKDDHGDTESTKKCRKSQIERENAPCVAMFDLGSTTFCRASPCLRGAVHFAFADAPALQTLAVYPPDIHLVHQLAAGSPLSSRPRYADGITRDVTAEAQV